MSEVRKSCETFQATIYISGDYDMALEVCRQFCEIGFCVSVTETEYIYTYGQESGVIVGIINYPRFPAKQSDLRDVVWNLAHKLCVQLHQGSFTVVYPDITEYYSRKE